VLRPRDIAPQAAAEAVGLRHDQFEELLADRWPIDTQLAERLGDLAGTSRQFWLNLQSASNLAKSRTAAKEDELHYARPARHERNGNEGGPPSTQGA
jgi:plasmid maintenance system antidote protein VapI